MRKSAQTIRSLLLTLSVNQYAYNQTVIALRPVCEQRMRQDKMMARIDAEDVAAAMLRFGDRRETRSRCHRLLPGHS